MGLAGGQVGAASVLVAPPFVGGLHLLPHSPAKVSSLSPEKAWRGSREESMAGSVKGSGVNPQ